MVLSFCYSDIYIVFKSHENCMSNSTWFNFGKLITLFMGDIIKWLKNCFFLHSLWFFLYIVFKFFLLKRWSFGATIQHLPMYWIVYYSELFSPCIILSTTMQNEVKLQQTTFQIQIVFNFNMENVANSPLSSSTWKPDSQ